MTTLASTTTLKVQTCGALISASVWFSQFPERICRAHVRLRFPLGKSVLLCAVRALVPNQTEQVSCRTEIAMCSCLRSVNRGINKWAFFNYSQVFFGAFIFPLNRWSSSRLPAVNSFVCVLELPEVVQACIHLAIWSSARDFTKHNVLQKSWNPVESRLILWLKWICGELNSSFLTKGIAYSRHNVESYWVAKKTS